MASTKRLRLVIDLDTCVGCHACAVSCKEWNDGGLKAPLTDEQPYGYETGCGADSRTVHFPRSCLH